MIKLKLFFLFTLIFFYSQSIIAQPDKVKPLQTLIIDPGHGGQDPGAKGTRESEANVALAISLKLGDTLAKAFPDLKIVFTRKTDILPGNLTNLVQSLRYRADLANESNGDLFISIHCNSAGKAAGGWYERRVVGKVPYTKYVKKGKKTYKRKAYRYKYSKVWVPNKAKGTETYLWALNKDDAKKTSVAKNDFTEDMDSLSTLALPDPTDPAEKVRMLIYTRHFFKKSLQLADLVQEQFKKAGRIDRGVKQRNNKGIWVLQATAMPSILIEIGFISNKEEEDYMLSDKGQKEIVGNIFTAIKKYKETLEKQASPVKKVPVKPVKTPN